MFSKKAIYECVLMNVTCSKSMLVEKDSFAQPWLLYKWKKDIKIVLILNSYLITSNMKKKNQWILIIHLEKNDRSIHGC